MQYSVSQTADHPRQPHEIVCERSNPLVMLPCFHVFYLKKYMFVIYSAIFNGSYQIFFPRNITMKIQDLSLSDPNLKLASLPIQTQET